MQLCSFFPVLTRYQVGGPNRQAYYTSAQAWQTGWPMSMHPYVASTPQNHAQGPQNYYHYSPYHVLSGSHAHSTPVMHSLKPKTPSPSPSPSPPPPDFPKHWDAAIRVFLERVGLTQALSGFQADMLVMNEEWESTEVPEALNTLVKNLSVCGVLLTLPSHLMTPTEPPPVHF